MQQHSQRVHRSLEVLRRRLGPIHKANGQPDLFRHDGAWYGDRGALEHALVPVGRVLDFGGWDLRWGVNTNTPMSSCTHILATADDQVLFSVRDVEQPVPVVNVSHVARVVPALGVDGFCRGL